jgi:hypothetical protein
LTSNEVTAQLESGEYPRAAGVPLDLSVKSVMESRFGLAFDEVRIHAGPWAASAARALSARAFTFGHDIFFADGEYAPQSDPGRLLLAHELVHVVQQHGMTCRASHGCAEVGDPSDPLEIEADRVAAEVFGTGPIPPIHRDTAAAVRRAIRINPDSVVMTVGADVKKAKPAVDIVTVQSVQTQVAIAHLTEGINVALAAGGAGLSGIVVNPVIKMSGKGDVVGDPGDDVTQTSLDLNFIQIATVFQLEDTYAGRTSNEGHIKMHHRKLIRQNFLLDSIASSSPFAGKSHFISGKDKQHAQFTCDLGRLPNAKGDSPGTQSAAVAQNSKSKANNFLFELKCDLGLTTVLVAADSGQNIQPFFHVNWKLLWHFQFKWKGGQNPTPTAIAIASRADVGQPIKGAPTDPGVAAVLQNPAAPFFNDITNDAKVNTAQAGPPLREDFDTALAGLPNDFFT